MSSRKTTFWAGFLRASSTIRRSRIAGYSKAEPVSRNVTSRPTASRKISTWLRFAQDAREKFERPVLAGLREFEEAAFALKPGEYGIAESQYGYHVIQVEESKPEHVDTPEEAHGKIIEALRRKNGMDFAKAYMQQDLTATLTG